MTSYNFGPNHPLKPVRLVKTIELLQSCLPELVVTDPAMASRADLERVHSSDYVDAVAAVSSGQPVDKRLVSESGFLSGDNPPFPGMYEASLAYVGGSVRAAQAVCDGAVTAFNWAGGLHHARRSEASGFCVFNDCAVACAILRDKFDRVAYVDIDLHHGDGVQWIFYDDPTVMTCSIHEDGRYLYPGTGSVEETGRDLTSVNAPLAPLTTGDTWLMAMERVVIPSLQRFEPRAIVLQMGADAHVTDPLGHLMVTVQEWLAAIQMVKALGLPIVALGGGGYDLANVPRMWTAATLTLLGLPLPMDRGLTDKHLPEPRWQGLHEAEAMVRAHEENFLKS